MNDVILNKVQVIERCIKRIHEEYDDNPQNLNNFTKQDSIILNIQRACEACIDLAMHIISEKGLGIPQTSGEAFELLYQNNIIDKSLTDRLKAMVGFRNIAVHDYQKLNMKIVERIIEEHLDDFKNFARKILELIPG
ncbi:uncharacterized protein YutE (UPF0331/DUF86 family) [Desulfohalotomaculum tongense]|uniref:type VII toxin-antitoxin system HepT family RNase toxin n=1 Tax=Desulforadius tongensis TaxID=1216062 RepID=UPI00195AC7CD|nr:DUF86 domain-containing protein [Desulforadius tongensis]MBM7853688.1 uncharacterized protein YutE (UPF0331/DUF86 family) [Desulforadius tongensis]